MVDKIIMLTNGNVHGLDILKGLSKLGISIDVVFETHPKLIDNFFPKSTDILPIRYLKAVKSWWIRRQAAKKNVFKFVEYANNVYCTGPLNSKRMVDTIRSLNADYLILGGIGILKPNVIEEASKGVLNTHPGLLPWARGSAVVGRSIESDIACGGTCHYVNAGIDKGDVIERRLVELDGSETSLQDIEQRTHSLVVQMMIDTVSDIVQYGNSPKSTQQTNTFPIFKTLFLEERNAIDSAVAVGKAKLLFEQWRIKTSGKPLYKLPEHIQE